MLRLLRVRNFTLIDDLELEFERGFNLLSGETGAGKSLIVDALGLIAGNKASGGTIRSGESRAIVEALLDPPGDLNLAAIGIDGEETELIIRREISTDNRNRVFINNQPSSVTALRSLQPLLLEIHGQHEQQTLLDAERQLLLIDSAAKTGQLRLEVHQHYDAIRKIETELDELSELEENKRQRRDLLEFQHHELEQVKPSPNEADQLRQQIKVLQNSEKLLEAASQGYQILYEADSSIVTLITGIEKSLMAAAQHDTTLKSAATQAGNAKATLEDVAYALRDYLENIDLDPSQLEDLQSRLAELERLHRKYGPDLLAHLQKVSRELDNLGLTETRKIALTAQLDQLKEKYNALSRTLRSKRQAASEELQQLISSELESLAMPAAKFSIDWQTSASPGPTGMDKPIFTLSPNPGEAPAPLTQIASGGELSRVMLALRTVLSQDYAKKTLVFDEIDAGIGGEAAETVGRKLKELSSSYQVLCVTHLSQVARFSDHHWRIEKSVLNGRTVTRSVTLTGESRLEEIARMMSGSNVTEAAIKHVRDMLKRQ